MLDPIFSDDAYREAVSSAERELVLVFLKAVPELKPHLEEGLFDLNNWTWPDGKGFMEELLRCCGRLVDQTEGKEILPRIFSCLEGMAMQLDSIDLAKEDSAANLTPKLRATYSLLFAFTDNPTGQDFTLRKLTQFMGPRISKMSCQL